EFDGCFCDRWRSCGLGRRHCREAARISSNRRRWGSPPIDKPCGEGLMPDGISALQRLGIAVRPQDSYCLRGIQFRGAGLAVGARFPSSGGLGVRRTILHRIMTERAGELGVGLLWGTVVTGISSEAVNL